MLYSLFLHDALAISEENTVNDEVVRYRGEGMHMVRLARVLPERRLVPRHEACAAASSVVLQVVVVRRAGRSVGLVVERILDITSHPKDLEPGARAGVSGTTVVDGRVTEVLDLQGLLAMAGISARASESPVPALAG